MEIKERNVWQVGAGDGERVYDDICLKYDVMMVGPGDEGPYDEETYAHHGDIKHSIRRFYREAKTGDVALLRLGTNQICAVGEIADAAPSLLDEFGDIDGWALQHVRRVRWFSDTRKDFPSKTLGGQVRTFAGVNVKPVLDWLEHLRVPSEELERPLAGLPKQSVTLEPLALANQLFIEGLSSEYIEKLMTTLGSIRRVAEWYWNEQKRPRGRPSESETLTYLVIPLLFALGWSQQTAAIEWNDIDVALFQQMPSQDNTLDCVVEAKSLEKSVLRYFEQAKNYANQEGRSACKRIIVTDGIRYAVYRRKHDDFDLDAYLNILRMRREYFTLGQAGGAVQAIMGMAR